MKPMAEHIQCSSHAMFEQLIKKDLNNLTNKIAEGLENLAKQSAINGTDIKQVLQNQSDRRELCGRQNARIDEIDKKIISIQETDKVQWDAINNMRKYIYIGLGVITTLQFVIPLLMKIIYHN